MSGVRSFPPRLTLAGFVGRLAFGVALAFALIGLGLLVEWLA
jgi:hypothetical protein